MITRPTLLFALLLASSGCTSALIAQNEPKSTGAASSWITTIKQEWSKIYNDIEAISGTAEGEPPETVKVAP